MFLKDISPLILYDVERRMPMKPTQGKWASSRVDLGYTELFCIPEVTSVFFSSCDSVLGDSLEFSQAKRGSLHVCLRTWNCSTHKARECSLISRRGGCLMGFLELRQEPGVYSRVTAGMAIRNSSLFSEVRTPVYL